MKHINYILLFYCCLALFSILSIAKSDAAEPDNCVGFTCPTDCVGTAWVDITFPVDCASGGSDPQAYSWDLPAPFNTCAVDCAATAGVCSATLDTCLVGTFVDLVDTPTDYQWRCSGWSGGPDSPTCTSPKPVGPCQIGVCGGVVTNTGCGGDIHVGGSCSTGQPSLACPAGQRIVRHVPCGGGAYAYTCQVDAACSAPVNGTCGTADGGRFYKPPTTNLCGLGNGIATPMPTGTGPHPHTWTWTCGGSGGGIDSTACTATQKYDGVCSSSHDQFLTSIPSTNLCAPGFTASAVAGGSAGPWTWSCPGLNTGLTTNCSSRVAVNGSCGTANGVGRSTAPSANLCGTGAASAVTGTGPWTWSCAGTGVGSTTASCSAPLPPPPPTFGGVCP
jgi:hypothetical protein